MYFGFALIAIGIIWYIAHAIIYNHYFAKNVPDVLYPKSKKANPKNKKRGQVTVIVTEGVTPGWVALLGVPPIPIFLLGVLITIVFVVIGIFT